MQTRRMHLRLLPCLLLASIMASACGDDSTIADTGIDGSNDVTSEMTSDAPTCEDTDTTEPNDDFPVAAPAPDESLPLILCPGGVDYYYFDATVGVDVQIFVGASIGTVTATVYGADESELDSSSPGAPTSMTFTPPADGRYYVAITGCCADTIPYTLRVN